MFEKVNEILDFWFGSEPNNLLQNVAMWWQKDNTVDEKITAQFAELLELAKAKKLAVWHDSPKSCLALIILLDQFSRHIYRDRQEAFAADSYAIELVEMARVHKLDKDLSVVERQFFYMPYMHAESLAWQHESVALFHQLVDCAREEAPQYLAAMEDAYHYAQRHYDIIAQFGRFPHRNAILGRDNTQEEMVFLRMPGSIF